MAHVRSHFLRARASLRVAARLSSERVDMVKAMRKTLDPICGAMFHVSGCIRILQILMQFSNFCRMLQLRSFQTQILMLRKGPISGGLVYSYLAQEL